MIALQRMLNRNIRNFIIGLIAAAILSYCYQGKKTPNDNILVYNQHNAITSLDPAFARSQANVWVIDHIFNGLVSLNDSGGIIPAIAKSWEISKDRLKVVFTLRDDVFFQKNKCFPNGARRVVANDIVFSFNRIIDKKVASPGSWIFNGLVDTLRPFVALNDSTFEIKLQRPFAPLLGLLTMPYCSVIPQEAVAYYGSDFRKNPVGTGPFILKKWIEGQGLFLTKNNQYYEKGWPKIEGIRVTNIPDRNTAFVELKSGNIHLMSGIESSYAYDLLDEEGKLKSHYRDKLIFSSAPFLNTEYLGFNVTNLPRDHPLRDIRIRRAIALAIDKQTLVRVLRNSIGTPAYAGFCPNGLSTFDDKLVGNVYDPVKAKKMISEFGRAPIKITLNLSKDYLDLCTTIARQLAEIGVTVELQLMDAATLREGMRQGNVSFFRGSWIGDYPDAENFFSVFYSKNGAPPNYTRFKNEEFDALYLNFLGESDFNKKKNLSRRMEEILIENVPLIPLFYDKSALIYSNRIKNLYSNPLNIPKFKYITLE
jgi:oligopeptide transport system substrate-binding protein